MGSAGDTVVRRRGRPQRLPEDPTPIGARTFGYHQRIAWLITTSRVLSQDARLVRRAGFISALAEHGSTVDNSRVSRWESGMHPLSMDVIAMYETVLGLPQSSLVAVAAGLRRVAGDGKSPLQSAQVDDGAGAEADLDRLLELTERGAATGAEWFRLAGLLSGFERVYLRQHEWASLCRRLVSELATSVGQGHAHRFEAAAAMIRHPQTQRHLTRALGSFVMTPDAQVVAPVLSLLAEVRDGAANELVLRLLHSDSRNLRSTAASVAAMKVARGHFGQADLPDLEHHVVGSLRRGESLDGRLDSFDLAVHLPEEAWARALVGLRNRRALDLVAQARKSGELVPGAQTAAVINELTGLVQRDTFSHDHQEPDSMLRRLLREALLHAHKARRLHAATTLAASPYAAAVSRHCLDLAGHRNDLLAARAWTLLMRVGHGGRRPRVLLQALAETRPTIKARALINLGLSPEPVRPLEVDALLGLLEGSSEASERHATMFALGMTGAPRLWMLAHHETEWMARSAEWWVRNGRAIHDADVTTVVPPGPGMNLHASPPQDQPGGRRAC